MHRKKGRLTKDVETYLRIVSPMRGWSWDVYQPLVKMALGVGGQGVNSLALEIGRSQALSQPTEKTFRQKKTHRPSGDPPP